MLHRLSHDITQFFNGLEGTWTLQREIKQATGIHLMNGRVTFTRQQTNHVFHYQEKGGLRLANTNQTYTAYHAYGYGYQQNSIQIHSWDDNKQQLGPTLHILYFSNGVKTDQEGLSSTHTHCCNQDQYTLHYTFVSPSEIKTTYLVEGPRKDYTIQTTLFKVHALHKNDSI